MMWLLGLMVVFMLWAVGQPERVGRRARWQQDEVDAEKFSRAMRGCGVRA